MSKTLCNAVLTFFLLVVALTILCRIASAQMTIVKGTVSNKQGDMLANAKITFFNPQTGLKFTLKTNKDGKFSKIGIPPAPYKVTFELEGYFPFELSYIVTLDPAHQEKEIKASLEKIPPKIEQDPDYAAAINIFRQGKYKEAIESFKKSIEKFPDRIEPRHNLAIIYLREGKIDEAIEQLEKAVEINPKVAEVYRALGEAYFSKGEVDKALEVFAKALQIQPDNPKIYYNQGIIYYKNDKMEDAIRAFEISTKLDPNFSSAYYQLGLAYVKTGDYEKAIKNLEEFIRLEPTSSEVSQIKSIIEKLKKE